MPDTEPTPRTSPSRSVVIPGVLFALALGLQVGILLLKIVVPDMQELATVRGASALDRSAILAFGDEFAAYMTFLRETVPPGAQVVVPPMAKDPVLGNIGLMQYFLLPRPIINCADGPELSACVRSMNGPTTYTLRIADYPNPRDVPPDRRLLASSPERGVYAPPQESSGSLLDTASRSPLLDGRPMIQLAAGILLLAALGAVGGLLTLLVDPRRPPWRLAGIYFPLGIGLTTWTTFVLSRLGMTLDGGTVLLTLAGLLFGGFVALRRRWRRFRPDRVGEQAHPARRGHRLVEWTLLILLLVSVALQIRIAIGASYAEWDSIAIWSAKGYGIAHEGDVLAAATWGSHGLSYPLNIPLGIALMRMVQGDAEPISKLIFPLFYASLLMGSIQFWLRRGITLRDAAAGGLLIATIPVIFVYGSNGYANLPFATTLVLGALGLVEGIVDRRPESIVIGGLLLGCASWTRVEGIAYVAALLALGFIAALALQRPLRPMFTGAGIAFALYAPWWATAAQATSSGAVGQAVATGLSTLQDRALPWDHLLILARVTARHMLTPTTWGLLVLCGLFLGWSALRRRTPMNAALALVASSAAVTAAVTAGIVLVRSLTLSGDSFRAMLDRSLDRHLLPSLILVILAVVLAAALPGRSGVTSTPQVPEA